MNPKKKWFPVPDSLTKRDDGRGKFYNIEARFEDHPVINVTKSQEARTQIYDTSIVLHTRIVRGAFGPAIKNMSSQPIRFDKGRGGTTLDQYGKPTVGLRQEDFNAAKALIQRCWEAWEYYQSFRTAPVSDLEEEALRHLARMPHPARALPVARLNIPFSHGDEDEDEESYEAEIPQAVIHAPAGGRKQMRT